MVASRSSRVREDESEEPERVPSQPGLQNKILPGKTKIIVSNPNKMHLSVS